MAELAIAQPTRHLLITQMANATNNFGLLPITVTNEDGTQHYEAGLPPRYKRFVGEILPAYSEEPYEQTLMRHGCAWVQKVRNPTIGPVIGHTAGLDRIEFDQRSAATMIREEEDRNFMRHLESALADDPLLLNDIDQKFATDMKAITPFLNPQTAADIAAAWTPQEES